MKSTTSQITMIKTRPIPLPTCPADVHVAASRVPQLVVVAFVCAPTIAKTRNAALMTRMTHENGRRPFFPGGR